MRSLGWRVSRSLPVAVVFQDLANGTYKQNVCGRSCAVLSIFKGVMKDEVCAERSSPVTEIGKDRYRVGRGGAHWVLGVNQTEADAEIEKCKYFA